MKLVTLNTHSLIEENYEKKLADFVRAIAQEKPDVIALQEVNQSIEAKPIEERAAYGYTACLESTVIRSDNHALQAAKGLYENRIAYHWTWLPVKNGYGKYDEGLALMTLAPIQKTNTLTVSRSESYENFRTRKILGIATGNDPSEWFYSVHYGWWEDKEEPFSEQWEKTLLHTRPLRSVFLMGDFNCPAKDEAGGYDLVQRTGWHDSYLLAEQKDSGITVDRHIDGWRDTGDLSDGLRIDQIWHNEKIRVLSSNVIFNGKHYPTVSDHFGVMIECERSLDEP